MIENNCLFSFVSPVYGCRQALSSLTEEIESVCSLMGVSFEIILVDDQCPQNSWEEMLKIAKNKKEVTCVKLSRNFGQHAAIEAGIAQTRGDYVIVLDCDLQDHPKYVPALYEELKKGYDIVVARRDNRTDSFFRRFASRSFYKTLNFLTGIKMDPSVANYGIYSRKIIDAYLSWNESHSRYFPITMKWLGYNRSHITIEHTSRHSGASSYSLRRLLSLAMDVITSFSDKVLRLFVYLGLIISLMAFSFSFIVFVRFFFANYAVTGWTSTILSIWFLSGIIIASIGVSGIYIGRIFTEVKKRPAYVISKKFTANNSASKR